MTIKEYTVEALVRPVSRYRSDEYGICRKCDEHLLEECRCSERELERENARLKEKLKTLAEEAELYRVRVLNASPGQKVGVAYPSDLLNAIIAAREEEEV